MLNKNYEEGILHMRGDGEHLNVSGIINNECSLRAGWVWVGVEKYFTRFQVSNYSGGGHIF